MTAHPIDTEALRRLADAATEGPWPLFSGGEYVGGVGIVIAPDDGGVSPANAEFIAAARTAVPALLDALAAAEHRATRAEAQNADEIRAVAAMTVYSEQALQEAAELMHSVKLAQAEARIKAVRELCDRASRDAGTLERNLLGGHRLYPKEIRRALDGTS